MSSKAAINVAKIPACRDYQLRKYRCVWLQTQLRFGIQCTHANNKLSTNQWPSSLRTGEKRQEWGWTELLMITHQGFFLADTSVRSPRKSSIASIKNHIYRIKVSSKHLNKIWKQKNGSAYHPSWGPERKPYPGGMYHWLKSKRSSMSCFVAGSVFSLIWLWSASFEAKMERSNTE